MARTHQARIIALHVPGLIAHHCTSSQNGAHALPESCFDCCAFAQILTQRAWKPGCMRPFLVSALCSKWLPCCALSHPCPSQLKHT